MQILVDADSCPKDTREMILRFSDRLGIKTVFAANRPIPGIQGRSIGGEKKVIMEICPPGEGAADDRIVELARQGDLVVTRDLPLAERLVEAGIIVLDDRGTVFTKENNCVYTIVFHDVDGCITQGDSIQDGLSMANDALCLFLYHMEEEGKIIPTPSNPTEICVGQNQFVTLVGCDTLEYRKFYEKKAVKKTLTIPSWLNTMAESENINFSKVLQEALKNELNAR